MTRRSLAVTLLVGLTSTGCIQYVSPSRTRADYETKAVNTAEAVLSAVATAALTVAAVEGDRTLAPTATVLLSEAETDAGAAAATFQGVQPPDADAEETGDELGPLIDDAISQLRDLRIAARRNQPADIVAAGDGLDGLREQLEAFVEAHA